MELDGQWWRRSCEESPYAICFVGLDDRFLWVNNAWEKLCGYPSSALVGLKRWQDITAPEDIGAGQKATEDVREERRDRYYDEKEYIGPLGDRRGVGLWIVKHPEFGPQDGYLVFGKPLEAGVTIELAEAFAKLERDMVAVKQTQDRFDGMEERIVDLRNDVMRHIESLSEGINALVGRGGVTIGDVTGRDRAGRDNNSTQTLIILGIVLVAFAVLVLGGALLIRPDSIQIGSQPAPVEVIVE